MNIGSNPSTQQSSLEPLYSQTQQELRTPVQNEAVTANPVEEAQETSNEQNQPRVESGQQDQQGRIDIFA